MAASIRRLPEDVISQLRSSVTITSLSGCLQQLLMNSLDASATIVSITVNLPRNSITIEDDGDGILPSDTTFVCQRYCTSKILLSSTFGYHGEALSSLSAHSHLTVASRHRTYRSTHSVRFHYGTLVHRGQVTADAQMLPKHGTVVKVDRLWGNMPVRLKSREAIGVDREWSDITRVVTELALVSNAKIVVRDENGRRRIGITHGGVERERYLQVLNQVAEAPPSPEWETVKAGHAKLSVYGIISLAPSASKAHQYIYLDGTPIAYSSTSLLYATINQYFSSSTFGQILDENIRPSRRPAPRKAFERHPLFVLTISTDNMIPPEDVESETSSLQDILSLLQKMVEEFLRIGGWKRKALKKLENMIPQQIILTGKRQAKPGLDISLWSRVKSSQAQSFDKSDIPQPIRLSKSVDVVLDKISWMNPAPKQTILLDPQTGNVLKDSRATSRISLPPRNTRHSKLDHTWAKDVVETSINPVFAVTEPPIPECSSVDIDTSHACCSTAQPSKSNISRADIRNARVVSQVDKKYILALLPSNLLVMIDQHAADERIRVEQLWREMCDSSLTCLLRKSITFIVSPHEASLFSTYITVFERWQIFYTMQSTTIEITALPSAVADRCSEQPNLAIHLLRSFAHELEETPSLTSTIGSGNWLARLQSAPNALVKMINSRACRSAIMFNDSLMWEECCVLVERLAECSFPFQCAHGRPSMVPLVDIGGGEVEEMAVGRGNYINWMDDHDASAGI